LLRIGFPFFHPPGLLKAVFLFFCCYGHRSFSGYAPPFFFLCDSIISDWSVLSFFFPYLTSIRAVVLPKIRCRCSLFLSFLCHYEAENTGDAIIFFSFSLSFSRQDHAFLSSLVVEIDRQRRLSFFPRDPNLDHYCAPLFRPFPPNQREKRPPFSPFFFNATRHGFSPSSNRQRHNRKVTFFFFPLPPGSAHRFPFFSDVVKLPAGAGSILFPFPSFLPVKVHLFPNRSKPALSRLRC